MAVKLTKQQAIEKLERQIQLIDGLQSSQYTGDSRPAAFKKWQRDTQVAISNIFGEASQHNKDFTDITYTLVFAN